MSRKKKTNKAQPSKAKSKKRVSKLRKSSRASNDLRQIVLGFLRENREQPYTVKQLAQATGLWEVVGNPKLRSILDKLSSSGQIAYLDKGKYQFTDHVESLVGEIQFTRSGAAFLLVDEGDDVFISPSSTGKAMNKDIVKVKVIQRRRRNGKQEGQVIEVLQRARTTIVGTLEEGLPGMFFLLPDDPRLSMDFRIPKETKGLKEGLKVLAKIINWDHKIPEAEILSILGEAGEHNTEMHAILLQYGFNPDFPAAVEAEAEAIPEAIPAAEIKARRDMREVLTFTIDPVDAKDFDDALSIQTLENGNIEVGVHIADVSYYVRPDTELDREAFERATSVYLVDRTVPMLPEKLSNMVCSLRPHEDKLTYSAVFEMNAEAKVLNYWVGRTVIHSDQRFHYRQAQDVLDGVLEHPLKDALVQIHDLGMKLRSKRMGAGSIEFESTEVKFELDEKDKPVRVIKKESLDTNKLIEDFMLLANRTVAAHIHGLFSDPPLPSVYRIHDHPNPDKLSSLAEFANAFGHEVRFDGQENETSENLNTLLKKVQGTPEQNVIETIAIRSMAKAVYTTKNIGHFGLGFQYYTHFTSPIRRYPDLMIHRLLTWYHNKEYKQNATVLEGQLKHCSDRERTAAEAERASVKYKQVEFLSERIGQQFTGVISGLIEAGIFVELEENLCEGFVAAARMEDDYYYYDESTYSMIGKDNGRKFRLGDKIEVTIASTNLKDRKIDMVLAEVEEA